MFSRRISLVLMVLMGLVPLSAMAAGKVNGTFKANGKTVKLTHVYAAPKENPFDNKKTDMFVAVADRELPAEAMFDTFAMMSAMEGGTGYTMQIDEDKRIISGQFYSPHFQKMQNFSSVGSVELELTASDKEHIAGKVWMEKENDFFDNLYQVSFTFDTTILAQPVKTEAVLAGTPLPAGGGDPGKAYMNYRKVMASGKVDAIRKVVVAEQAKGLDDPEFKKMLPLIIAMQPKDAKIVKGAVDGDTATLKVTGKDEGGGSQYGTVTMVKEGGAWKLKKESWSNKEN